MEPSTSWMVQVPNSPPVGPLTTAELIGAIAQRRFSAEALVSHDGKQTWAPIGSFPELRPRRSKGMVAFFAVWAVLMCVGGAWLLHLFVLAEQNDPAYLVDDSAAGSEVVLFASKEAFVHVTMRRVQVAAGAKVRLEDDQEYSMGLATAKTVKALTPATVRRTGVAKGPGEGWNFSYVEVELQDAGERGRHFFVAENFVRRGPAPAQPSSARLLQQPGVPSQDLDDDVPPPPGGAAATKPARSVDDCRKSEGCHVRGECGFKDGKCQPGSTEDCTRATNCKTEGSCKRVELERQAVCQPTSNADCAQSDECKMKKNCAVFIESDRSAACHTPEHVARLTGHARCHDRCARLDQGAMQCMNSCDERHPVAP